MAKIEEIESLNAWVLTCQQTAQVFKLLSCFAVILVNLTAFW